MCGRYSLHNLPEHLKATFEIHGRLPNIKPRYNIAPTQLAPVIGLNPKSGEKTMLEMKWGLVPSWAKEPSIGNKLFNARSETLTEKPSFKGSIKKRRCIIPASGFYEWQKVGAEKLPHYFSLKNGEPMGFAGLWAEWGRGDEQLHTFTIITTSANEVIGQVHERMPVILNERSVNVWLDPQMPEEVLEDLLRPLDGNEIQSYRVSKAINRALVDNADLIAKEPANSA